MAVNIIDNKEPLIDLIDQDDIIYGPSPEVPNNTDYTKLRKTVYEKLIQAQALLPQGLYFCIFEGYRSLYLQKFLFDNRYDKIQQLHPKWTHDEIFIESTRLISPVINPDGTKNIPAHSTGGAFDVYLINDRAKYIDMGIHPKDWMADNDGAISATSSTIISEEAKKYRKIMCDALLAVDFVNYPAEYWHWSYGDRYWAYHKKAPHAIYGEIK